jgi:hypothetical protein
MHIKYDWNTDELKLKPMRAAFLQIPDNCYFVELNFKQIKKCIDRLNNVKAKFTKEENFEKCQ